MNISGITGEGLRGAVVKLGLVLLLVVSPGIYLWKNHKETVKGLNPLNPRKLPCSDGYREFPPRTWSTSFLVPGGNCWSEWQVRPPGAAGFEWDCRGLVEVMSGYRDGTTSTDFFDPSIVKYMKKWIGKARFRNPGKDPVECRLTFNAM